MALVGTFAEPIPKFNAHSQRANQIFFDEFYPSYAPNYSLQDLIDEDTEYADDENTRYGVNGIAEYPIIGNDFYSHRRLLIFGYTPIELFELFFQVKSVHITWTADFSVTDLQLKDDDDELVFPDLTIAQGGWGTGISYHAISSYAYDADLSQLNWIIPVERVCDGKLGHLYSDVGYQFFDNSMNYRSSISQDNFFDHYNVYDFRNEGKGLAINVMPIDISFTLGRQYDGNYVQATANLGKSYGVRTQWNPALTEDDFVFQKVPVEFIDGQKKVNAEIWMNARNLDGMKLNSMNVALTIEIERFEFET